MDNPPLIATCSESGKATKTSSQLRESNGLPTAADDKVDSEGKPTSLTSLPPNFASSLHQASPDLESPIDSGVVSRQWQPNFWVYDSLEFKSPDFSSAARGGWKFLFAVGIKETVAAFQNLRTEACSP